MGRLSVNSGRTELATTPAAVVRFAAPLYAPALHAIRAEVNLSDLSFSAAAEATQIKNRRQSAENLVSP